MLKQHSAYLGSNTEKLHICVALIFPFPSIVRWYLSDMHSSDAINGQVEADIWSVDQQDAMVGAQPAVREAGRSIKPVAADVQYCTSEQSLHSAVRAVR